MRFNDTEISWDNMSSHIQNELTDIDLENNWINNTEIPLYQLKCKVKDKLTRDWRHQNLPS